MLDRVPATAPTVVLVVEDEPLLRELAVEFIEDAGFVALEAGDADEAVALLEARPDIAVLFTDVNMPGSMDGLKLADMVRNRWPPIKILVASGQLRPGPSDLPSDGIFLGKPYCGEAVIAQLHLLVDPTGTSTSTLTNSAPARL